jgi:hypothetical protein
MLLLISRHSAGCGATARRRGKVDARILLLLVFLCAVSVPCRAESGRVLCREGFGSLSSQFSTGVTVSVGASKNGAFATHACDATLRWGRNALPVAQGAWEVDIDVMGADLGLGAAVVAFQIRNSELDRLATYEVFSLVKPPHLLRTITGGDEYDAKDMNLRDRNEIWTDDARAVDGFESLPLSSWDFSPTVVLRFEDRRLVDVSSEFQAYFDHQVAQVKSLLDANALNEFRKSDGNLSSSSASSLEDLHMLLRTKIQVLEIVWSYLSSGREQQAWSELAAMWPPADLDRMREAIQDARTRGILRQVSGVSKLGGGVPWKRHATIFDCIKTDTYETDPNAPSIASHGQLVPGIAGVAPTPVDSRPEPIYLGIPFSRSQDQALPDSSSKIYLNLVIDAAGKVHSAKLENKADNGPIGDKVLSASADWNFIPAFVGSHAVACRLRFGVWPEQ